MIKKLAMIAFAFVGCAAALPGCRQSSNVPAEIPTATSPDRAAGKPTPHTFEGDLQYVRNGQYAHIWVFSRKDGHPLDKDDAAFLRTNATQVVDWVTTDEGKKVIAGTNFDLALGNLGILKGRFVVEDYTGK